MFGGCDSRMAIDNEQLSSNSRALVVSVPSANNSVGQDSPVPGDGMQNGMDQQAESIVFKSKKLQDDLQELGHKIKHHEDNVNFLKSQKHKLDALILDLQVALGKHLTTNSSTEENDNPALLETKEEIIQRILKNQNSAAALLCKMTGEGQAQASEHFLIKDVVGIVAALGKVEDANLSRLLSKYLGLETMLAVVCRSYEGFKSLESYSRDGSINKGWGIHSFAASAGISLEPFTAICIEKLTPYNGELVAGDPQGRLNLIKPRLPNGETAPGFVGYAVNMILIDNDNLYSASASGHSLRETLFYNLFSHLQVYKTREDMLNAMPLISDGAISLDGGLMRSHGICGLAHNPEDIDVKFLCISKNLNPSSSYIETENQLKETRWKKERASEDAEREQQLLENVRFKYETKKREFVRFLAESSSFATQYQAVRASTPR